MQALLFVHKYTLVFETDRAMLDFLEYHYVYETDRETSQNVLGKADKYVSRGTFPSMWVKEYGGGFQYRGRGEGES